MTARLMFQFRLLCIAIALASLLGCFETLEKESSIGSGSSDRSIVENNFNEEIQTLEALALTGSTLNGLWLVFYSEEGEDSAGTSFGQHAWSILRINHSTDSTTLTAQNLENCSTDSPVSYQYTVEDDLIKPSSFVVPGSDSILNLSATADVVVSIDSSGRILSFADYIKSGDDASSVSTVAHKLQNEITGSFGTIALEGVSYEISCLSYADAWVEASGDDIRQAQQTVSGGGPSSLVFSVNELKDESKQTDQDDDLQVSDSLSVDIQAEGLSETFSTVSAEGISSAITLSTGPDLSFDAVFARSDGVSGSLSGNLIEPSL
ncbi:MAG: hypothetical protein KUG83_07100 [Gammaproteobacteria bacterium]|nr:hypothetical protein [Gammaproteobacteria bacterium]